MQTYVSIHAPYTHTCTTKYHQNVRYTQLASLLYETPGHNERSALSQLFLLFFGEKPSTFQWKAQFHEKHSAFQ